MLSIIYLECILMYMKNEAGYTLRYSRWQHAPLHVGLQAANKLEKKKKGQRRRRRRRRFR